MLPSSPPSHQYYHQHYHHATKDEQHTLAAPCSSNVIYPSIPSQTTDLVDGDENANQLPTNLQYQCAITPEIKCDTLSKLAECIKNLLSEDTPTFQYASAKISACVPELKTWGQLVGKIAASGHMPAQWLWENGISLHSLAHLSCEDGLFLSMRSFFIRMNILPCHLEGKWFFFPEHAQHLASIIVGSAREQCYITSNLLSQIEQALLINTYLEGKDGLKYKKILRERHEKALAEQVALYIGDDLASSLAAAKFVCDVALHKRMGQAALNNAVIKLQDCHYVDAEADSIIENMKYTGRSNVNLGYMRYVYSANSFLTIADLKRFKWTLHDLYVLGANQLYMNYIMRT